MIEQVKKFVQSEDVKKDLISLKNAEVERIATSELMQPKYDALLKENSIDIKWSDIYLLKDDVFDMIMKSKNKIDNENGFELQYGYCPILVSETKVRDCIKNLIEKFAQKVDANFESLFYKLDFYKRFKELIISIAMIQK